MKEIKITLSGTIVGYRNEELTKGKIRISSQGVLQIMDNKGNCIKAFAAGSWVTAEVLP